jgi:hypothetical protein
LALSVALGSGLLTVLGYQVLFAVGAVVLLAGAALTLRASARQAPVVAGEPPVPVGAER